MALGNGNHYWTNRTGHPSVGSPFSDDPGAVLRNSQLSHREVPSSSNMILIMVFFG